MAGWWVATHHYSFNLTCAHWHVAAPGPVLGARPDGGAVLLHPVARLALEADVLADGEVFPVAEAVGGNSRVTAVYHCINEWGRGVRGSRGQTCGRFVFLCRFSSSSPEEMTDEQLRLLNLPSVAPPNGRNASHGFSSYYLPCRQFCCSVTRCIMVLFSPPPCLRALPPPRFTFDTVWLAITSEEDQSSAELISIRATAFRNEGWKRKKVFGPPGPVDSISLFR